MTLLPDKREFVELLNSHGVEYVIAGTWARSLYGIPRSTGEIDFFGRPTPGNAGRIVQALERFGFGSIGRVHTELDGQPVWFLSRRLFRKTKGHPARPVPPAKNLADLEAVSDE